MSVKQPSLGFLDNHVSNPRPSTLKVALRPFLADCDHRQPVRLYIRIPKRKNGRERQIELHKLRLADLSTHQCSIEGEWFTLQTLIEARCQITLRHRDGTP
jgi:hypothetical protein